MNKTNTKKMHQEGSVRDKEDISEAIIIYFSSSFKNRNAMRKEGKIVEQNYKKASDRLTEILKNKHKKNIEDKKAEQIISQVCYFCGIDEKSLKQNSRKEKIVECRHIAMYIVYKCCQSFTISKIAEMFGRHHSSLLHAKKSVENLLKTNIKYKKNYSDFIDELIVKYQD
jgi:chromosomal replication initiator protein